MDSKTIVAGAIVLLAIGGLLYWGRADQAPRQTGSGGASALVSADALHDFGTISMKDGNVETMFAVSNPTDKDITLASLTTSCMCTNAYIENGGERRGPFGMPGHGGPVPRANEVVPAGGTLDIAVVYDPNAHGPAGVGPIDRFIYLVDNEGRELQLEIKANVTP